MEITPEIKSKIEIEIDKKLKEKEYLENFLSTCYKGSDVKEKTKWELRVIDAYIKGLRFCLPPNPSDDLPF